MIWSDSDKDDYREQIIAWVYIAPNNYNCDYYSNTKSSDWY